MVIFYHFDHFWPFWPVFLDFFINGTLQRAEVFSVAFSASKPFVWAIKINNTTFFLILHPKGGPFWFRGGKILPSPKIIGLERKQKRFWNRTTMENKLGTCRMLGVDFDENKYPPSAAHLPRLVATWEAGYYKCHNHLRVFHMAVFWINWVYLV